MINNPNEENHQTNNDPGGTTVGHEYDLNIPNSPYSEENSGQSNELLEQPGKQGSEVQVPNENEASNPEQNDASYPEQNEVETIRQDEADTPRENLIPPTEI
jgi:hypothetical protein